MNGFVDWHHHCVWGMDDGAKTYPESCRMLELAAKNGITTVAATPHVYPGYRPFDREVYQRRLEQLRRWAEAEKLPLELLEGAEVWYTDQTLPMLREGRIPTLAGTSYVLLEFSPEIPWCRFEAALMELCRWGYIPVVAHVERYRRLYGHTAGMFRLRKEQGICFQVNASAIVHSKDLIRKMFLKRMLDAKAVDMIATDAHDCRNRPPEIQTAFGCLEERYGREYAQALTGFQMEEHLQKLCNT